MQHARRPEEAGVRFPASEIMRRLNACIRESFFCIWEGILWEGIFGRWGEGMAIQSARLPFLYHSAGR